MPNRKRTRLGVLGGTFDPPHFGHLAVALEVQQQLALDKVLLVVANDPWQKSTLGPVTAAALRLAMVESLVEGFEDLEASTLEIERGGASYTADTLAELRVADPDAELFLVLGSDAAAELDTWERPAEVRRLATTVVVERGAGTTQTVRGDEPVVVVAVPVLDISSSDLRTRFAAGRPVEALLPPAVAELIRSRGLYGACR